MNDYEKLTATIIEDTLQSSPAYRKIEDGLYVVKQGSAYVMINVLPLNDDRCVVRCVAQVVAGIEMNGKLAIDLLSRNARSRMGAFAYEPDGQLVLLVHTILGGTTLDPDELLQTLADVALLADEVDDELVDKFGGQRMKDLVEDAALSHIMDTYGS